jgi:hypothetical protein
MSLLPLFNIVAMQRQLKDRSKAQKQQFRKDMKVLLAMDSLATAEQRERGEPKKKKPVKPRKQKGWCYWEMPVDKIHSNFWYLDGDGGGFGTEVMMLQWEVEDRIERYMGDIKISPHDTSEMIFWVDEKEALIGWNVTEYMKRTDTKLKADRLCRIIGTHVSGALTEGDYKEEIINTTPTWHTWG